MSYLCMEGYTKLVYNFDEFLKIGAENDSDIEKFVTKKLFNFAVGLF